MLLAMRSSRQPSVIQFRGEGSRKPEALARTLLANLPQLADALENGEHRDLRALSRSSSPPPDRTARWQPIDRCPGRWVPCQQVRLYRVGDVDRAAVRRDMALRAPVGKR